MIIRRKSIDVSIFIILGLIFCGIIYFITQQWSNVEARTTLIAAAVASFSVFSVLYTYYWTKSMDRFRFGNEKRHQFIFDQRLTVIRSRIEHNDIELQAILAVVNSSSPYDFEALPAKYWKLHEQFDAYLNWIEGLAILWKSGLIEEKELEGLWKYYTGRLKDVNIPLDKAKQFLLKIIGYDQSKIELFIKARIESDEFKYPLDPLKSGAAKIDPITQPIWFYINWPPYEFTALKELIIHLHRAK